MCASNLLTRISNAYDSSCLAKYLESLARYFARHEESHALEIWLANGHFKWQLIKTNEVICHVKIKDVTSLIYIN